jgi:hypothetical protein
MLEKVMANDVDAANIIKGANGASLMPGNGAAVYFRLSFSLVRRLMSRDDFDFASSFGCHWAFVNFPRGR